MEWSFWNHEPIGIFLLFELLLSDLYHSGKHQNTIKIKTLAGTYLIPDNQPDFYLLSVHGINGCLILRDPRPLCSDTVEGKGMLDWAGQVLPCNYLWVPHIQSTSFSFHTVRSYVVTLTVQCPLSTASRLVCGDIFTAPIQVHTFLVTWQQLPNFSYPATIYLWISESSLKRNHGNPMESWHSFMVPSSDPSRNADLTPTPQPTQTLCASLNF